MESAIPRHLTEPRIYRNRKAETFRPPYPSYVARFDPKVEQVVMAYLGVQFATSEPPVIAREALAVLAEAAGGPNGPDHHERARYVDEAGYTTILSILYWTDPHRYDRWRAFTPSWTGPQHRTLEAGFFAEVVSPTVRRFETLFSANDRMEGVAVTADEFSGEVREHAYWGGARDRIPLSQTNLLKPSGEVTSEVDEATGLITVRPNHNLCLIRSGQDWTDTRDDERAMYLGDVEPTLRAGMDFLRDQGLQVGCYANRYMRVLAADGSETEKSFGMSWWHSLEELETWAESHPTHVAIFRAAMKYLSTVGPAAKLRLYHEVSVVEENQQSFQYLGCHRRTGMLRALPIMATNTRQAD